MVLGDQARLEQQSAADSGAAQLLLHRGDQLIQLGRVPAVHLGVAAAGLQVGAGSGQAGR